MTRNTITRNNYQISNQKNRKFPWNWNREWNIFVWQIVTSIRSHWQFDVLTVFLVIGVWMCVQLWLAVLGNVMCTNVVSSTSGDRWAHSWLFRISKQQQKPNINVKLVTSCMPHSLSKYKKKRKTNQKYANLVLFTFNVHNNQVNIPKLNLVSVHLQIICMYVFVCVYIKTCTNIQLSENIQTMVGAMSVDILTNSASFGTFPILFTISATGFTVSLSSSGITLSAMWRTIKPSLFTYIVEKPSIHLKQRM